MVFTSASDPRRPIVFANDSFLLLSGYARAELLGRSLEMLMADPDDIGVLRRLEAEFGDDVDGTLEIECRRKDGRRFLGALFVSPVHDEAGEIVQHFVSLIDITRHVDRIRKERDELYSLYRNAPGFIAITEGPEHRFSFVNASSHLLFGHREISGRPIAEAVPELAEQGVIGLLDQVYATGKPLFVQGLSVEFAHEGGMSVDRRCIDFVCQPVRGSNDEVTGLFCQAHDVTSHVVALEEVRTLQAKLIHLSRVNAMGTMAKTLAHELNQPLTAISNYSAICRHLIAGRPGEPAELERSLRGISENIVRAGEIIQRIRNMTKRGRPQREPFDLRDAVAEAVALVRSGACSGAAIGNDVAAGLAVCGDRIQIQQVIMNLVRNACEATAGGDCPLVAISSVTKGRRVIVSVDDGGPGLPAELEKTLFDWTDSAKPDGMGIGLSISRTIIEAHKGKIWFEPSARGGARFSFSIALASRAHGARASA
ncbi:MAG: PAS domain-containing protein [Sphingomonas sp.]